MRLKVMLKRYDKTENEVEE